MKAHMPTCPSAFLGLVIDSKMLCFYNAFCTWSFSLLLRCSRFRFVHQIEKKIFSDSTNEPTSFYDMNHKM